MSQTSQSPTNLLASTAPAAILSVEPIAATDPLLSRREMAAELTSFGFTTSEKTLATLATRGGGPSFQKFGARVLYRRSKGFEWAESRLSPPRRSTSESDAAGAK